MWETSHQYFIKMTEIFGNSDVYTGFYRIKNNFLKKIRKFSGWKAGLMIFLETKVKYYRLKTGLMIFLRLAHCSPSWATIPETSNLTNGCEGVFWKILGFNKTSHTKYTRLPFPNKEREIGQVSGEILPSPPSSTLSAVRPKVQWVSMLFGRNVSLKITYNPTCF